MHILDLPNDKPHLLTEELLPNGGYWAGAPRLNPEHKRMVGCAKTAAIFGSLSGLAGGLLAAVVFWAVKNN